MDQVFIALILSLRVAAVSTLVIAVPAIALGYVLAQKRFVGHTLLSAFVTLPLVLPPTAIGYLLLLTLSRANHIGLDVLLTWKAAVIASAIVSFPLAVRTARVAFNDIDRRLLDVASSLGWNKWQRFYRVTLPLSYRGLLAALVLAFTRAIGEFGATITVAGSIPGETETLATAIFGAQQLGDDGLAIELVAMAFIVGIIAIASSEYLSRSRRVRH